MAGPSYEEAFLKALQGIGPRPVLLPQTDFLAEQHTEILNEDHPEHTTEAAPPPSTVTPGNIWRHPDAHPLVLDYFLIRKYGMEWMGWEAETLRHLIPGDFNTQTVSELNISKLQACRTLHMVDSFWQRWEIFIACLKPFNGEFPDFASMHVPTVAQCLVSADIANRIRSDVQWSTEMKAYLATVFAHDGIFLPIPPLDFVKLDVPEEINHDVLAVRWHEVRASGKVPTEETVLAEQLRRLYAANEYLEESRAHLHHQLHLHA